MPIRLNGVDAPELDQRGGQSGKRWMQTLVLRKPVRCSLTGVKTYDRWVGTCFIGDDLDLGAQVIAAGHARIAEDTQRANTPSMKRVPAGSTNSTPIVGDRITTDRCGLNLRPRWQYQSGFLGSDMAVPFDGQEFFSQEARSMVL